MLYYRKGGNQFNLKSIIGLEQSPPHLQNNEKSSERNTLESDKFLMKNYTFSRTQEKIIGELLTFNNYVTLWSRWVGLRDAA